MTPKTRKAVRKRITEPVPSRVSVATGSSAASAGGWTFLTNHTHVLLCLHSNPGMRLRDVASSVGITERAVQRIVADLEIAGILRRQREGRRNRYSINAKVNLRHSLEEHIYLGQLLELIDGGKWVNEPPRMDTDEHQ